MLCIIIKKRVGEIIKNFYSFFYINEESIRGKTMKINTFKIVI